MPETSPRVLGRLLVAAGAITEEALVAALETQQQTRERLGEVLVRGGLDPEHVARALAAQLRLPYAEPPLTPEPPALKCVEQGLALRHRVVPLTLAERALRLAMADPLDANALDDLRFQTGRRVEPVVAAPTTVDRALAAAYGPAAVEALLARMPGTRAAQGGAAQLGAGRAGGGFSDAEGDGSGAGPDAGTGAVVESAAVRGAGPGEGGAHGVPGSPATGAAARAVARRNAAPRNAAPRNAAARNGAAWQGAPPHTGADTAGSDEVRALRRASEAPPVVALVDLILARAAGARASDLHIEPSGSQLRVRARIDGVLRPLLELPDHTGAAVVSRLKIMAGLDIAVKRRPQDGRGAIRVDGREFGLRVSTLPANDGEKVVLRLLDSGNAGRRLDDVGIDGVNRARLDALLGRGHGVLLVTGPTGSGKTTTLYAALGALDRERRNLITLEDPIEYRLPGLTQVQVHRRAGLTFAAALRAVLRQDPDVIMVGEMRDSETAEIGMAAALTGHLVLSTLHTNDAPGAVARLVEMGTPRYLVAGALIGVLAQRLARRLCPHCRVEREAEGAELAALGLPTRAVRVFEPGGCDRCDGTGYHGRIGIFELLTVDARVRRLVLRGATADAIRDAARADGMTTLGADAWAKVRSGLTSLGEVRPFLSLLADEAPLCPACGAGIRPAYRVCPACGHALRAVCGCGLPLEDDWRHCPRCGEPAPSEPDRAAFDPAAGP